MKFLDNTVFVSAIVHIGPVIPSAITLVHNNRPYSGLAYITEGENEFIFKNGNIKVSPGKIIFLPEGSSYKLAQKSSYCFFINFKITNLSLQEFLYTPKNQAKLEELFSRAEHLWRTRPVGYYSKCMSILYSIINYIERDTQSAYTPNKKAALLLPALEYIRENYTETTISVEHLALLCKMSPAYFRKLFRQVYGVSPLTYINEAKIARAKELLLLDEYTIEQVAGLSGYNETGYFRREFKKYTEQTPREYRENSRLKSLSEE